MAEGSSAKTRSKSKSKSKVRAKARTKGRSVAKGAASSTSESSCLDGEPIRAGRIVMSSSDKAEVRIQVCNTASVLFLYLDGALILEKENPDREVLELPQLSVGDHELYWSVTATADEWQTKAEFLVNGAFRFRHMRSNESSDKRKWGFLLLGVQ